MKKPSFRGLFLFSSMHKIIDWYNKVNQFGEDNGYHLSIIKPGEIEYEFTPNQKHQALPNYIHGGVIAGLMDAVLSVSGLSIVAADNMLVSTIEFKINYLSSVKLNEKLIAKGKVIRRGKRILVTEGMITGVDISDIKAVGNGSLSAIPFDTSQLEI